MSPLHTLLFFEPGHFHAALLLKSASPRIARDVHVYAAPGPEREAFAALVASFNARAEAPTGWRVRLHDAAGEGAALDALIADRRGGVAVLAGRNASKLAAIARLHAEGFAVLADKPWITRAASLPDLDCACAGAPLAADIMPDRHELLARLRRRVVETPAVFGGLVADDPDGAAIELRSVHHLYKIVNGRPLRRPAWYYDADAQGDGMVDVHSHLTDQAQWLVESAPGAAAGARIELDSARRWSTPVPPDLFRASTGLDAYPESLSPWVRDGVLHYPCNGEIRYRIGDFTVRQVAEWGQREPAGGGDLHGATLRGSRARVVVCHGPETGFVPEVHLAPRPGVALEAPLRAAVAAWQDEFPGLGLAPSDLGFRLVAPPGLHTGHESHFAKARDEFLDWLDAGRWPEELQPRIHQRYALLAQAQALAVDAVGGAP